MKDEVGYKEFWDSLTQRQRRRILFGSDVDIINCCIKRDWDKIHDEIKNEVDILSCIDHHIMRNNLEENFTSDIVKSVENRDFWKEGWLM